MTTTTANMLLGTYWFLTPDAARKMETIGRKAGFIVCGPQATVKGWKVTVSVPQPDTATTKETPQ